MQGIKMKLAWILQQLLLRMVIYLKKGFLTEVKIIA
jgi:hypothetical protein